MSKLKKFLYLISKPLNQIEINKNGQTRGAYSLDERIIFTLKILISKNTTLFKIGIILNLIKHIFIFFLVIIFLPVSLILFILNIRFANLNFTQIGAFSTQADILIKNNLLGNKHLIVTFIPEEFVCNKVLLNIFSNHLIIIKKWYLSFALFPFIHNSFLSIDIHKLEPSNLQSLSYKINSKFNKARKDLYLDFKKNINTKYINLSKKYKKIITIHVRENNTKYGRKSSLRYSNFHIYKKSIRYLSKKNYHIIRFVDEYSSFKLKNYTELKVNNTIDQYKQIFFIINSVFTISNNSGVQSLANMFNVPNLTVDSFPYHRSFNFNKFDLTNPKLLRKNNKNILLNEYLTKYMILNASLLNKYKLTIKNNDQVDVYKSVNEILKKIKIKNKKRNVKFDYLKKNKVSFYGEGDLTKNFLNKIKANVIK